MTQPRPRFVAHLGTVYVDGRPVGPHMMRFLRVCWANGERHIPRARAEYKRRMSAMHAAYRAKTKGRR